MRPGTDRGVAQVWVWLHADDPEAVSALAVAREMSPPGAAPLSLRRFRLMELSGVLPQRQLLEELLRRSIQFYNPQKEGIAVRLAEAEPTPLEQDERAVVVFERGGARREGAERWWRAEAGAAVAVREGTVWALRFAPGRPDATAGLVVLRDRRHGLLCNPHAEEHRVAGGVVPMPWLSRRTGRGAEER